MVISGLLFLSCIFISGSYSNSELKYTKGGRDLRLIPRLFLGERKINGPGYEARTDLKCTTVQ